MSWEDILKRDMSANARRKRLENQRKYDKMFEEAKQLIKHSFVGDSSNRDGLFSEMMVIHEYMEEEPAHFKELLDEAIKYVIDNNTKEEIVDWYYMWSTMDEGIEMWYMEEAQGISLDTGQPFTEEENKRREITRRRLENQKKVNNSMRAIKDKLLNEHFRTHDALHQYRYR